MLLQSFFVRLLMSVLLMTVAVLSVVMLAVYEPLNENYQQRLDQDQQMITRVACDYFTSTWPQKPQQIEQDCKKLFNDSPVRLTVIAFDGQVLGDSQAISTEMENHKTKSRPEVISALQGKAASHIRPSDTLGIEFVYYAMPIKKGDKVVGCLRTAMPVQTIAEGAKSIRHTLIWAILLAIIVGIVLATFISWLWQRPLREVALAARRIADGNLRKRVRVSGASELTEMAKALNEMRENISDKIRRILSQQENLSAVIENLNEGVVAIDNNQHILLCNSLAKTLLQSETSEVVGLPIQQILPQHEILSLISQAKIRQKNLTSRIRIQKSRITEVQAIPLVTLSSSSISMLVVLRDISEAEKVSAMKTQFVANASHELRTPLATIRAAVDSLMMTDSLDEEIMRRSLNILDRHARRLEEMTNDLLDLQMTENAVSRREDVVTLASLEEWITANFSHRAAEKIVKFEVTATPESFQIRTDLTLIHLILQNLLTNAIKFTPEGGTVTCWLTPIDDRLKICVEDTGCGIAKEFQARVFERFFQVEPSRTGDSRVRGSGLGLAIVKHACLQLDGDVQLQSKPGKGTTITVNIPT